MGSGFRTFQPGEVLTGDNVQGYLMKQANMSFANAAGRDAVITAPEEGMVAILRDVDIVTIHNGTGWVPTYYYGSWTPFTPTWSADSGTTTVGNGTLDGKYARFGSMVFWSIRLSWGTTTTTSVAGANWRFALPVDGDNDLGTSFWSASAWLFDSSPGNRYMANGYIATDQSPPLLQFITADGASGIVDNQAPFIWATGDRLNAWGFYEAA